MLRASSLYARKSVASSATSSLLSRSAPTIREAGRKVVTATRASSSGAGSSTALELDPSTVPQHEAYSVVRASRITEHAATAVLYRHRTGAQLLSVLSSEEEKVFGAAFKTPVSDDTGVPHILEHSVLCGSKKYPLKEPFVELLKSSLQTYLNAMTYADRTVYPVASPNTRDFYHLVDVYLDAVFRPRLEPWVLQQEGWHYEIEPVPGSATAAEGADAAAAAGADAAASAGAAPGAQIDAALAPFLAGIGRDGLLASGADADFRTRFRLGYRGVVFNEMKGVYSSPEAVRSYATEAALFPGTAYRHSSGGDPLAIPKLSYEAFLAFHRRHYRPANARLFFFGDDDPGVRLGLLHEYLGEFEGRTAAADAAAGRAAGSVSVSMARAGGAAASGLAAGVVGVGGKATHIIGASSAGPAASEAAASASAAAPSSASASSAEAWPGPADAYTVRPQPLWAEPRRLKAPYPCEAGEMAAEMEGEGEGEVEGMIEEGAAAATADAAAAGATSEGQVVTVNYGVGPSGAIAVQDAASAAAATIDAAAPGSLPVDTVVDAAAAEAAAHAHPRGSAVAGTAPAPDKHDITVNWVLHDTPLDEVTRMGLAGECDWVLHDTPLDEVTRMGLAVLGHLLMRTQVSTLYKALTDSALGSAVIGGGFDDSQLQATFSAGLKGVKEADVPAVEALIQATLEQVARQGFSPDHIASTLNSIEFALREFASGGGPRGLSLFLGSLQGWLYGRDPVEELRYEAPLARLKDAIAAAGGGGGPFFAGLVQRYLLANTHRLAVHMYPDPAFTARREEAERAQLDAAWKRMTPTQAAQVLVAQRDLLRRQQTPDDPAEVAKVPTLQLSDLPRDAKAIARAVKDIDAAQAAKAVEAARAGLAADVASTAAAGIAHAAPAGTAASPSARAGDAASASASGTSSARTAAASSSSPASSSSSSSSLSSSSSSSSQPPLFRSLVHEQPSNGIGYASMYFDLSPLPHRLLPLVPLFAWCLTSTGTAAIDEVAMAHTLGLHTGGVGAAASCMEVPGRRDAALPFLVMGGKALAAKTPRLADIMHQLLTGARLDRQDRVAHFLRSTIAAHEAGLVSSGHRYASALLAAQYSKAGWMGESLSGLAQLHAARTLLRRIDSGEAGGFDGVAADLAAIRLHLLRRDNVFLSMTGDETTLHALEPAVCGLAASLPDTHHASVAASGSSSQQQQGGLKSKLARLASGWHWPGAHATAASHSVAGASCADHASSADDSGAERAIPHWPLEHLIGGVPDASGAPMRIGLVVPTQVSYVAKAAPAFDVHGDAVHSSSASRLDHSDAAAHLFPSSSSGAASAAATAASSSSPASASASASASPSPRFVSGASEVVSHLLRTGYLWERVRVQGGAYGAFASVNRSSGMVSFGSYRDPHLGATIDAFDGVGQHLRETAAATAAANSGSATGAISEDLRKAIISTIGSLDAPQSPEERGDTSTARYLLRVSDGDVAARRAQVLGAGPDDIAAFAAAADRVASEGRVVVVSSQAAFDDYHRKHKDEPAFALLQPLAKGTGAASAASGAAARAAARAPFVLPRLQ